MTRFRINPGEFRHVITFQTLSKKRSSYGSSAKEWVDVKTARAAIYPVSGKEFFSAEKINSEVSHKIQIRYIAGITSDMQIKFGERTFEIKGPPINFQERNILLQLMCKELF